MNRNAILYPLFLTISSLVAMDQKTLAPVDEPVATEEAALIDEPNTDNSDAHKVRKSLGEELDAVSSYETRIATTNDPELKKIFEHTKGEEKEHIAMLLDWLRKNDHAQDEAFKKPGTAH